MMKLTLEQYIRNQQSADASGRFTSIMTDVTLTCRMIASLLRSGSLNNNNQMTKEATKNLSGDEQAPLDIQANNLFLSLFENNRHIAAIVSEELDEIHYYESHTEAQYFLVIDPLDGSGNLDINAPVATIFSLAKCRTHRPNIDEVLEEARRPIAAGICCYGLNTTLAITTGNGVHGFSQDLESGTFFYTHPNMEIKPIAKEVAINFSNRNFWNKAVLRYVDECFMGVQGPRNRYFNTRWYASAAAELNRILVRGGIFIYPACSNGKPQGVLRKLYEAWPMAYLVEQANGLATDGLSRILDMPAKSLHEKTPFAMGTKEEVEILSKYHKEI